MRAPGPGAQGSRGPGTPNLVRTLRPDTESVVSSSSAGRRPKKTELRAANMVEDEDEDGAGAGATGASGAGPEDEDGAADGKSSSSPR